MASSANRRLSSVSLPRIGGLGHRKLRLRGDAPLLAVLEPGPSEAGSVEIPTREPVTVGERVCVEIGFGALLDEVELFGTIASIEGVPPPETRAPKVRIEFDAECVGKVRYVIALIEGTEHGSKRAHRRIPTDMAVRWKWGFGVVDARVEDLSLGGAFIRTHVPPRPGATLDLELTPPVAGTSPIVVRAAVAWVSTTGPRQGFGAQFRFADRRQAAEVRELVRAIES